MEDARPVQPAMQYFLEKQMIDHREQFACFARTD